MVKQMLFLDAPAHTRMRSLAAHAFTPQRVEVLRSHIREIANALLDKVESQGHMDVIADLAEPLPCIVTAEMLGVPVEDHQQLKVWSQDFAEMLGNFQHNPDRASRVLRSTLAMVDYFRCAIREQRLNPASVMKPPPSRSVCAPHRHERSYPARSSFRRGARCGRGRI